MKALFIFAAAASLIGCAATQAVNTRGEIVATRSVVYDASFAAKRGLSAADTAACEEEGRAAGWAWADKSGGGFDKTRAGEAFEACVLRRR